MRRPNPARAPRRRAPALVASVAIAAATLVGVPRAVEAAPAPDATTSFTWLAELSDLSLGNSHACGIDDNDEAYCWGNDTQLQLGDGLPQQRMTTPSPVAVAGTVLDGKKIVDIASGGRHSCALTDDDLIGCWGDNSMAQLGNGTYVGSAVPVAVTIAGGPLDGKDLTAITAGENQSCALTADGIAACWGANFNGQLGDGTTSFRTTPRAVVTTGTPLDGVPIDQIEATGQNTCALAATGEFGCTGLGTYGNLGRGSTANATKLVAPTTAGTVLDGKDIYAFGVGGAGACVATTDGELACWGADNRGQVGDGTPGDDELAPKAVTTTGTVLDDETVVEIAAGRNHTCVRTKEEILACWGAGSLGALGNGDAADSATPVAVKTEGTILEGLAVVGVASG
ncbi:MAG: hypothetical protein KDB33_20575, partial [Acidimicrobiales bacterium]|nr:hypothetical protein [Acidimicrobiales bacterium]